MDYFERILRMKDMEVWDVKIDKDIYRLFIVDEKRGAKFEDLNLPPDATFFEDDVRANLITVSVYSRYPVNKEHIEPIDQFAKQLTNHVALAHCLVRVNFYTGMKEDIIKTELKRKYNIDFNNIPLQKWMHLNQD